MAKRKILNWAPDERRVTILHEEDGKQFVETKSEITPIIEAAKMMAEQTPGKDFRHAAFIPKEVMDRAFVEGWFHDKVAWKRWANDPANADFRTWKGRL